MIEDSIAPGGAVPPPLAADAGRPVWTNKPAAATGSLCRQYPGGHCRQERFRHRHNDQGGPAELCLAWTN
jgi:hypothetical protein